MSRYFKYSINQSVCSHFFQYTTGEFPIFSIIFPGPCHVSRRDVVDGVADGRQLLADGSVYAGEWVGAVRHRFSHVFS